MRERSICAASVSIGLLLCVAAAPMGLSAPGQSLDQVRGRRSVAVNTLRAINTVEYAYRSTHGMFAPWEVLVASKEFDGGWRFAAQNEPQLAGAQFAKRPEILPGWALRLNVTSDGKGYDALLEDTTDKACGYAAITNESGLIRQGKAIDCEI